jgi:hypothetical protein
MSKIKGPLELYFGEASLLGLQVASFSLCPHMASSLACARRVSLQKDTHCPIRLRSHL